MAVDHVHDNFTMIKCEYEIHDCPGFGDHLRTVQGQLSMANDVGSKTSGNDDGNLSHFISQRKHFNFFRYSTGWDKCIIG